MKRLGLFLALFLAAPAAPAFAGEIWLTMDFVEPYKLPDGASQIVVGNPGIADIEVRDDQTVLLYGKAPGATNMFILDGNGEKVDNLIVRVQALGKNMLTVQRGDQRTTYNCLTVCETTLTVGDGASFNQVQTQVQQKFQQATAE